MSRSIWDAKTQKAVRALWAMLIGTIVLLAALFWLVPHLGEDGMMSPEDWKAVAGFAVVGALIAFPAIVMEGLGFAVNTYRAWRGK